MTYPKGTLFKIREDLKEFIHWGWARALLGTTLSFQRYTENTDGGLFKFVDGPREGEDWYMDFSELVLLEEVNKEDIWE